MALALSPWFGGFFGGLIGGGLVLLVTSRGAEPPRERPAGLGAPVADRADPLARLEQSMARLEERQEGLERRLEVVAGEMRRSSGDLSPPQASLPEPTAPATTVMAPTGLDPAFHDYWKSLTGYRRLMAEPVLPLLEAATRSRQFAASFAKVKVPRRRC